MNQHLLTEAIKRVINKIDKAKIALDNLCYAFVELRDSLPIPIEHDTQIETSFIELDPQQHVMPLVYDSTPNTVGIDPVINIALQIAKATDLRLRHYTTGECNFGYIDKNGNFREVYRLLKTWIQEWIKREVADIETKTSIKHITQELNGKVHAEYRAGKRVPPQIATSTTTGITTLNCTDYVIDGNAIRTVTPKSIAQAIAAATNLELFDGDVRVEGRDYYQIGYRTPIGTFIRVTDFRHDDIAIKIANKTVGDWMKATVTNIMEKTQGLKAVDDYRKRRVTR